MTWYVMLIVFFFPSFVFGKNPLGRTKWSNTSRFKVFREPHFRVWQEIPEMPGENFCIAKGPLLFAIGAQRLFHWDLFLITKIKERWRGGWNHVLPILSWKRAAFLWVLNEAEHTHPSTQLWPWAFLLYFCRQGNECLKNLTWKKRRYIVWVFFAVAAAEILSPSWKQEEVIEFPSLLSFFGHSIDRATTLDRTFQNPPVAIAIAIASGLNHECVQCHDVVETWPLQHCQKRLIAHTHTHT